MSTAITHHRRRAWLRAVVTGIVALVLLAPPIPAAAAVQPVDPIEGVWELTNYDGPASFPLEWNGQIRIVPAGDGLAGHFAGLAHTRVDEGPLDDCAHPEGSFIWNIFALGSGQYEGFHGDWIEQGAECVETDWDAAWGFVPDAPLFCRFDDPSATESDCWDMERVPFVYGTRSFGATVRLNAKGQFISDALYKPKGYRKTRGRAPNLSFDLMWDPRKEEFGWDASTLGLLSSGGKIILTDILGKGDNRRTERTVLTVGIDSRGSSVPLPDDLGFVHEPRVSLFATVKRSGVRGCEKGTEGVVTLVSSLTGDTVGVNIGSGCRYYSFKHGTPNANSDVDVNITS